MRLRPTLAHCCLLAALISLQFVCVPHASAQALKGQLQSLWQRTVQLYDQGRYPDAEATARRSIALASSKLGPQHKATARGSFELARVIIRLGRSAEAEKLARHAVASWTSEFGGQSAQVSAALIMLGATLFEQDRYTESHEVLARALRNLDVSKPVAAFHRGNAIRWQGLNYLRQGKLAEADERFRQALAASDHLTGRDRIHLHRIEANYGYVAWQRGHFSHAEQYFKRAISGYERLALPSRSEFAGVLARLASFYVVQERLDEAEALLRRSLALHQTTTGADSHLTALTLEQYGLLELERDRNDIAESLFRRALATYQKVRGSDHVETATAMMRLGDALVRTGKLDEAEPLLEASLALRAQKLGVDHSALSYDHFVMGSLHVARKDFVRGLSAMERGHALIVTTLGESHPAMTRGLRSLAWLHRQAGRDEEALTLLRRASDLAHQRHAQVDNPAFASPTAEISPRLRRSINAQLIELAAPGRQGPGSKIDHLDTAYVAAQRGRDTSAATAIAQMATRFSVDDTELAQLVRRSQDLSHQRNRLDRQLVHAIGESRDEIERTGQANRMEVYAERARVETEFTTVVQTLQKKYPDYLQLLGQAPLNVAETQALLAPGEAVVAFHVDQAATTVWVVSPTQATWHKAAIGRDRLHDSVDKLRCGLEVDAWADERRRERCKSLGLALEAARLPFDMSTAHDLYAQLLAPLESALGGANLFLVPAGPLSALPFHLLLTAPPAAAGLGGPDAFRQAPWLVRRHAMTVMPSVQSLRLLRASPASAAPKTFIGYGAPIFNRDQPQLPGGNRALTAANDRQRPGPKVGQQPLGGANFASLKLGLKPLPETRHELEYIAGQLAAGDGEIVLGARATESMIKKSPLTDYRIVYFATHALIQGEVGGLDEPALALTLPDQPSADDDGLLTASEIARLKLDADWVVLSACNTAAGQGQGAESLSGLARAFFYAGTRSLLVSHWKVNSEAAVKLTTATFAVLSASPTSSRGEALRHAMLVLADSADPEEAHPSYWAPFFVVGDSANRSVGATPPPSASRPPSRSP